MDYKKIIAESWQYTQENKKLIRWYGFLPAIFTTTVSIGYLSYQFFSLRDYFTEHEGSFLGRFVILIWRFIRENLDWTLPLLIFAAIFGILYFLYPTLAKASAIQMIARNRNGQQADVGTGFRYGIRAFLPMIEYHLLIKTFSFLGIFFEMSLVLRNLGVDFLKILLPIFVIFMVISLILTLLFTYADFYIVIDGMSIFDSIKMSAKLVLSHWKHTFLITILMMIIGIRIFFQAVLVFLIPAMVILVSGYLATVALPTIGIIVGALLGSVGLVLAAYLNGIVDIFSYTVWTFTFLELTAESEISAREKNARDEGNQEFNNHQTLQNSGA